MAHIPIDSRAPRAPSGRALAAGVAVAAWVVVVFGLYNAGLPQARLRDFHRRWAAGERPELDAVRAYLTNDGDVRRYFAYVQAALGRPHQACFVRSARAWRRAFEAREVVHAEDSPELEPGRALVPYRDFLVEYPPGFFLVAVPPALLTSDGDTYVYLFQTEMALALTVALALAFATLNLSLIHI